MKSLPNQNLLKIKNEERRKRINLRLFMKIKHFLNLQLLFYILLSKTQKKNLFLLKPPKIQKSMKIHVDFDFLFLFLLFSDFQRFSKDEKS